MFPFIIHSLLASLALIPWVLAVPLLPQPNRTIELIVAAPQIATGYTAQEIQQLLDGFRNAMELAAFVRDPACVHIVDAIFPKYFPTTDRTLVDGKSLLSLSINMPVEPVY